MNPSDSQIGEASVLLINAEGIVVDAQETTCTALGWTREEIVNKPVSELLEYGADLLLDGLAQLQGATTTDSTEGFSVSALVRRQDQSVFPTTVVVRPLPEANGFAVAFDDLGVEIAEATPVATTNETDVASTPEVESVDSPVASDDGIPAVIFAARANVEEVVAPLTHDAEHPNGNSHANANANSNGGNTGFRNIFLSAPMRVHPEPTNSVVDASHAGNGANGAQDIAAELETERQERRRLEARVVSLNDQLQQLHLQLKSNLESENIYQKRVSECEVELAKAEEIKAAAEAALAEEQQKGARLENDFTQLQAEFARREEERKHSQREWLAKLESSLKGLQESDVRVEKELAARRGIGVKLQLLQQDFSTEVKKQDVNVAAVPAKGGVNADSGSKPRVVPAVEKICA